MQVIELTMRHLPIQGLSRLTRVRGNGTVEGILRSKRIIDGRRVDDARLVLGLLRRIRGLNLGKCVRDKS